MARRVSLATPLATPFSASALPRFALALALSSLLFLQGCGSLLATFESGAIEDDPGERTFAQRIADESIETKAIVNLHAADDRFDQGHLVVQSYNGYVLIAGQVPQEELRQKANDVVRKIRDVRRIYNELEVAAASSAMTRASDTWIANKVKTFLLTGSDTPGLRVKVVAEDGVVYLLGMVTRAEADRIAEEAADTSGVQRVVRLFEYID
ncbi:BON domain-containing protein [Congregibacter litoralis]|uniref:Putative periplasmic or secreted lipoprotein n=1 Tax=Congregibacter litoralis KT71 TaxID=314285 RepID=A4A5E6_9GAMM|nr:BON domain-containing protein [Congregibacter litoralis]EAQ99017.1 putative periplasmic or secreted lipoprotein [Congregibacter litoralis KT71]